jgi:WD40 repeat protein/serine/threonine protein kinase
MSERPQLPKQALRAPLEVARRIHQICKQFESAWRCAARPQLVPYLADVSEPERSWLLLELLALDVELRQAAGEQPTEVEYRLIFPLEGDRQIVAAAFQRCASEAEPSPCLQDEGRRMKDESEPKAATSDSSFILLPSSFLVEGYEILEMLGRGGMGVVYKARDRRLKRLVALKMILTGEHAGEEQLARFRAEAEMVARLQHPNIVQIHEVREERGNPCIVFEYIKGQTLADFASGEPQAPRVAAELLEAIARAIHYAHEQGIVHRDLKPANILLQEETTKDTKHTKTREHEASLRGLRDLCGSLMPKITDFGLAKDLAANLDQTASGTVLGTPHYMSPEQAEGRRNIGPASDIYSLGAILYVLLTGRAPIQGTTRTETLHMVINTEPVAPTQLQPKLARDLETICLTGLRKDPTRRYQTAGALADDLRRFLNGEPILARPTSALYQLRKFAGRHRGMVGGVLGTGFALVLGTVFSLLFAFGEARQRHAADRNARAALRETYQARLAAAVMALRENNVAEAARQLDAAPPGLRGWEWQHLHARVSDLSPIVLHAQPEFDKLWCCFPRGSGLLAQKGDRFVLTDPQTRTVQRELFDHASFRGIVKTPAGLLLAYARPEGGTTLLDEQGAEMNIPVSWEGQQQASATNDRKLIAVWTPYSRNDRRLRLFELPSGRLRLTIEKPEPLRSVAFSPDGTRLAGAGGWSFPTVYLWDAVNGTQTLLDGHTDGVHCVAFHPDGKRLVSGAADRTVRQWDVATARCIDVRRGHSDAILDVTYSPDGQWIASSSMDKSVRIWKTNDDGELPALLPDHADNVYESLFSPDGLTLLTRGDLGGSWLRVWATPAAVNRVVLHGHSSFVYPVVYSPDGRLLASGGWDKDHGVRLWDAASGTLIAVLKGHQDTIFSLAFSPDSRRLVSRSSDETLRSWDTETGTALAVIPCDMVPRRAGPQSALVTPDGRCIVTGTEGGLRRWDLATGAELDRVPLPLRDVRILAVRPQDGLLAASGDGPNIVLFDLKAGQVRTVLTHTNPTGASPFINHTLAFSPDGRQLLSAGNTRDIQLWDVESGKLIRALPGHTGDVFAAIFHPDGKRIVSAGRDRMIRIWDPTHGDELVGLPGHTSYIFSLSFSPDGTTLASGSGDFTVRLWESERLGRRLDAERQEQQVRPEAQRLLERLFREHGTAEIVAERLRTETAGSAALERATRKALYRRQGLAPP